MIKTVKISDDTHSRLRQKGHMGETFDDVLNRLLNKVGGIEIQDSIAEKYKDAEEYTVVHLLDGGQRAFTDLKEFHKFRDSYNMFIKGVTVRQKIPKEELDKMRLRDFEIQKMSEGMSLI